MRPGTSSAVAGLLLMASIASAAVPAPRGFAAADAATAPADAAVSAHGSAPVLGAPVTTARPVVGLAATPTGNGYWLTASDGGIFTYGDATFHGSAADRLPEGHEAVAMASDRSSDGYWIASSTGRVVVAAAGDVHGEGRVRDLLARGGNPVEPMAGVLGAADVAVVNLETAVGSTGPPADKQYVFQAPPALLDALKAGGVDVVSLANNHALDHGVTGLLETLEHARAAGLPTVGAGRDAAEAYAPVLLGSGRRRVAVVGLSRVLSPGWAAGPGRPGLASAYDERAAVAAVRAASNQAPHVVVMVHWGIELDRCPDGNQRRLAELLVGAGADVVAGHHPHVLQGIQRRGSSVVAFSLGNFVWYHSRPPSDTVGVLRATLGPQGVVDHDLIPGRIDGAGRPVPLTGDDATRVRAEVALLTPGAGRC